MIRKILICALISTFLGSFALSRVQGAAALRLTVNAPTNVYASTDNSAAVIGRILPGQSFAITGRSALNFWYKIDFKGQAGWVSADDKSVNCPYANHIADGCPDARTTSVVDYQLFEHGMMLWIKNTREIFVLSNDADWGGWFIGVPDTWSGETLTQLAPPSGLQQPQMGFGKLWLNEPMVHQHLGWATSPERAYTTPVEMYARTPAGTFRYLRLPSGQVIKVSN